MGMRISRPLRDLVFLGPLYPALVRRWTFVLILCNLYAPNRTGLLSGRPHSTSSGQALRDSTLQTAVATPGLDRNAHCTEPCTCDPALIQPSRYTPACRGAMPGQMEQLHPSNIRLKPEGRLHHCGQTGSPTAALDESAAKVGFSRDLSVV